MNKLLVLLLILNLSSAFAKKAKEKDCVDPIPGGLGDVASKVATLAERQAPLSKRSYITPEEYRKFTSRELAEKLMQKIHLGCDEQRGEKTGPTIGDQSDIMMYVPSGVLDSVAKYGFQNQHVTRTSKGCNCRENRWGQENILSGTLHSYGSKAKDVLPKYSALNVRNKEFYYSAGSGAASEYGDVIFVFKEEVKKRSSWTQADSLGAGPFRGSPLVNTFGFKEKQPAKFKCGGYCETQIWGELDLSDVAYAIVNTINVPEALKKNGIATYLKEKAESSTGIKKGTLLIAGNPSLTKRPPLDTVAPTSAVEKRVWEHQKISKLSFIDLKTKYEKETDQESKWEILGEIILKKDPAVKEFLMGPKILNIYDSIQRNQIYVGLSQFHNDKKVVDFLFSQLEKNRDVELIKILTDDPFKKNKELQDKIDAYLKKMFAKPEDYKPKPLCTIWDGK